MCHQVRRIQSLTRFLVVLKSYYYSWSITTTNTYYQIPGYEHVVWDVSLVSDRIGSSLQHGLTGKLQLGDYLNALARTKIGKFRRDYAAKNIAFAPAILSVAGKISTSLMGVGRHADGQVLQSRWGRRGHRE